MSFPRSPWGSARGLGYILTVYDKLRKIWWLLVEVYDRKMDMGILDMGGKVACNE